MRQGLVGALGLVGLLTGLAWAHAAPASPSPTLSAAQEDRDDLPLADQVEPDWLSRPTGEDLAQLYPPLARLLLMPGLARITCSTAVDGGLYGCKIASEAPSGLGFGDATVLAAARFRMRPMMIGGKPVAGASVTVPLRWNLEGSGRLPRAQEPEKPSQAAPSEALLLARRVVSAYGVREAAFETLARFDLGFIAQAVASGASAPAPDAQARVLALLSASYRPRVEAFLEQQAGAYVASLTLAQLTETARFLESPAGQAWVRAGRAAASAEGVLNGAGVMAAHETAGAAFCRQTACVSPPASP